MQINHTAVIKEPHNAPYTDEEIETFALRIALLVSTHSGIDRLCDQIGSLLEGSGRKL